LVRLGELAGAFGELAHTSRIDDGRRHALGIERLEESPFEPACGLDDDAFHVVGLETARQRDAAVGVVAQPSRSSSYRRDVQMLLADIHTNPRAGCGHRVPALSAALSLATVRADDRRGRDRATRRLAPVVGCDLRPREAIPPRGDRFTDTVPESRETRLGQP